MRQGGLTPVRQPPGGQAQSVGSLWGKVSFLHKPRWALPIRAGHVGRPPPPPPPGGVAVFRRPRGVLGTPCDPYWEHLGPKWRVGLPVTLLPAVPTIRSLTNGGAGVVSG